MTNSFKKIGYWSILFIGGVLGILGWLFIHQEQVVVDTYALDIHHSYDSVYIDPILGDVGYSEYTVVGDFNEDGHEDLYVLNRENAQNRVWLGDGVGGFTNADIPGDFGTSESAAIGDFNGDGHEDIYSVNNFNQQNHIWLGDGAGGFTNADISGDTGSGYGVVLGDFNEDGDEDIYVLNQGQNHLWLGDGVGGFINADISGDSLTSVSVIVGDFNGDVNDDLYVVNNGQNHLWLGDGIGGFTNADISGDVGNSLGAIGGDFNEDGNEDFYVVNNSDQQNRVWLGNGAGGFMNADISGDIGSSRSVVVGDFNEDSHEDIYVTNYNSQNRVWLGDGAGGFINADIPLDEGYSFGVVLGDFNEDGYEDIYVTNTGQNRVWLGDGIGGFTGTDISGDTGSSVSAIVGDFNEDGYEDIYVNAISGQNRIWLGDGVGGFTNADILGNLGRSEGAVIGDFNEDGHEDIYIVNTINQQNNLRLGDGIGGFTNADISGDIGYGVQAVLGDFNEDGHEDIYVVNVGFNKVWLGDGAGGFTNADIPGDSGNSVSAIVGDFNEDGHEDIYVTRGNNEQNRVWLGDGIGGFTNADILGDLGNSYGSIVGDFNEDGHEDIYVSNYNEQTRIWLGDGMGGFTNADIVGDISKSRVISSGDFNEDGYEDIYIATLNEQNHIWLGDGVGGFTDADIPGDMGESRGIVIGDLNGDNHEDIYVANDGQNRLWLGDGAGGFTGADISGDTGEAEGVILGDFNGDGYEDIYVANDGQNNIWLGDGIGGFVSGDIIYDFGITDGAILGDFNEDQRDDIYVINRDFSRNILHLSTINYDCSLSTTVSQTECEALVNIYDTMGGNTWHTDYVDGVDGVSDGWLVGNDPCTWHGVQCQFANNLYSVIGLDFDGRLSGYICNSTIERAGLLGSFPTSITDLPNLVDLHMGGNEGINFSSLGIINQPLEQLCFNSAEVGNTDFLGSMNLSSLTHFRASNNDITSLSGFSGVTLNNLLFFDVGSNDITSLAPLATSALSSNFFYVNANQITDIHEITISNSHYLSIQNNGYQGALNENWTPFINNAVSAFFQGFNNPNIICGEVPTWVVDGWNTHFSLNQNNTDLDDILPLDTDGTTINGTIFQNNGQDMLCPVDAFCNGTTDCENGLVCTNNVCVSSTPEICDDQIDNDGDQDIDCDDSDCTSDPICQPTSAGLTVIKTVTNDNGGTGVAADFSFDLDDAHTGGNTVFTVTSGGTGDVATAGTYHLFEDIEPGYSFVSTSCVRDSDQLEVYSGTIASPENYVDGDRQHVSHFAFTLGENYTCTIINDDDPQGFDCSTTSIPLAECEALVDLYDSTVGDSWVVNTNWLSNSDVSSRYGVTTAMVNGQESVTEIEFSLNGLTGTLMGSIADLTNLTILGLGNNDIGGVIPPELGTLSSLTGLYLGYNGFTGTIPVELGNLSSITVMQLLGNNLTGTIPVELGNLSTIEHLYLSSNNLTGTIPVELGNLPVLEILQLNSNNLAGVIPPELGNITTLDSLSIMFNNMTGSIPPELGNLTNLTSLQLSHEFTGTIPVELGNLVNLTNLHLGLNNFTGTIPPELGNLVNLQQLHMQDSMLVGAIPAFFSVIPESAAFYINGNNTICGQIPAGVFPDDVTQVDIATCPVDSFCNQTADCDSGLTCTDNICQSNQPPVVTITTDPVNGTTVDEGYNILFNATASDSDGTITQVEFFNGTASVLVDTDAPYGGSISNASIGTYTLTAVATDNNQATTTSSVSTITVQQSGGSGGGGNTNPTVTITAPADGSSFTAGETILIEVTASDSDGTVTQVEFFNGSTSLGTDTAAPFAFTMGNAQEGTYTFAAVATDNDQATIMSSVVNVTVTQSGGNGGGGNTNPEICNDQLDNDDDQAIDCDDSDCTNDSSCQTASTAGLTVIKQVINDDGGVLTPTDFSMDLDDAHTDGNTVLTLTSGLSGDVSAAQVYHLFEDVESGYAFVNTSCVRDNDQVEVYSGTINSTENYVDGNRQHVAHFPFVLGESYTCTVVNDDLEQTTCSAGTYWTGTTCVTCEAGNFCLGGVETAAIQIACPVGMESVVGSDSSDDCTLIPVCGNGMCESTSGENENTCAQDCSTTDNDGDGVDDQVEIDGPNNGDANFDGTQDSTQVAVATIPSTDSDVVTSIDITDSATCTSIDYVANVDASGFDNDNGFTFPYGLHEITVDCASVDVTIWYHGINDMSDFTYRKLGPSGWFTLPVNRGVQNGVGFVSFTLTDGGLGDSDGIINGTIVDPGGLGLSVQVSDGFNGNPSSITCRPNCPGIQSRYSYERRISGQVAYTKPERRFPVDRKDLPLDVMHQNVDVISYLDDLLSGVSMMHSINPGSNNYIVLEHILGLLYGLEGDLQRKEMMRIMYRLEIYDDGILYGLGIDKYMILAILEDSMRAQPEGSYETAYIDNEIMKFMFVGEKEIKRATFHRGVGVTSSCEREQCEQFNKKIDETIYDEVAVAVTYSGGFKEWIHIQVK